MLLTRFTHSPLQNKPSEAIVLLEGTRAILIQLAGRLDQFSLATHAGGGVYLWNMTQQREFGVYICPVQCSLDYVADLCTVCIFLCMLIGDIVT